MRKRKTGELAIKINWSSTQDPTEVRPFVEAAKGLTSEILWSLGLISMLVIIVIIIWLIK